MSRQSSLDDFDSIRSRQAEIAIEENRGCAGCGTTLSITRDHRGCSYHYDGVKGDKDDPNYGSFCPKCWELDNEYWHDMWEEYYSAVMV
jgi:hypothetical protein